jgi:RNA polymerase sigma factor (sigma-70 family)
MSSSLVTEFYRQQHKSLVDFLYRKLGSIQEAYDVAQQTYERLLSNSKTQLINNPRAFVFKVANNIAIDHLRQRKVRGEGDLPEFNNDSMISREPSPDEQVDYELTVAMVRTFISELPAKCRSAFLYYKFEERDYSEIAEILHVSESMVRKYVLRAMAYCRERLDQCNSTEAELAKKISRQ